MSVLATCGKCDDTGHIVVDEEKKISRRCDCFYDSITQRNANTLRGKIPRKQRAVRWGDPEIRDLPSGVRAAMRALIKDVRERAELDEPPGPRGMWFVGPMGSGKTFAAALVAKEVVQIRRPSGALSIDFVTFSGMQGRVRDTFDDNAEFREREVLESLAGVDLLVIDDISVGSPSEFAKRLLYDVVNSRLEDERPIIVTSNCWPEELDARLDAVTVDRLEEICGAPLLVPDADGISHRKLEAYRAQREAGEELAPDGRPARPPLRLVPPAQM